MCASLNNVYTASKYFTSFSKNCQELQSRNPITQKHHRNRQQKPQKRIQQTNLTIQIKRHPRIIPNIPTKA